MVYPIKGRACCQNGLQSTDLCTSWTKDFTMLCFKMLFATKFQMKLPHEVQAQDLSDWKEKKCAWAVWASYHLQPMPTTLFPFLKRGKKGTLSHNTQVFSGPTKEDKAISSLHEVFFQCCICPLDGVNVPLDPILKRGGRCTFQLYVMYELPISTVKFLQCSLLFLFFPMPGHVVCPFLFPPLGILHHLFPFLLQLFC